MLLPSVREEDLYTRFALTCFELLREKVGEGYTPGPHPPGHASGAVDFP